MKEHDSDDSKANDVKNDVKNNVKNDVKNDVRRRGLRDIHDTPRCPTLFFTLLFTLFFTFFFTPFFAALHACKTVYGVIFLPFTYVSSQFTISHTTWCRLSRAI